MTSRFQEVFRLPSQQYIEGSPVIIEAGALQKDEQTGKILAQIKIKNISPNIIVGCKVFIRAFELSGAELQGNRQLFLFGYQCGTRWRFRYKGSSIFAK